MTVSQANRNLLSVAEGNDVLENDDTETKVHEEELECGDEDFREPFLTLSESSGSPVPSVCGEDDATEMVTDGEAEDVEEQRQREWRTSASVQLREGEKDGKREHAGMRERSITSPASVMSKLSLPELQVSSVVVTTLLQEP